MLFCVRCHWRRHPTTAVSSAARLITAIWRYDCITETLCDTSLAAQPTSQRIIFKIALMMFDCCRGRCPKYFGDVYTPVHTDAARSRLRSADRGDLHGRPTCAVNSFWLPQLPRVWSDNPERTPTGSVKYGHLRAGCSSAYGRRRVW